MSIARINIFLAMIFFSFWLQSCSSPIKQSQNNEVVKILDYYPTKEWRSATPEEQGLDSRNLANLIKFFIQENINLHSLLVVRNGYLILDTYFWPFTSENAVHDIASCTKSITSTLVGIAIDKGYIENVNVPLKHYFNNVDKEVTLKDLLTMSSGLKCESQPSEKTLHEMINSSNWIDFAIKRPQNHLPGKLWNYDSSGVHLLSAVISRATGKSAAQYAQENLFSFLGIKKVFWPADPQGITHGWGDLRLTPQQMAKIGLLFLNNGIWDGARVISKKWIDEATRNQVPGRGYGYLWWIPTNVNSPTASRSFFAEGRGGQIIYVSPESGMVVVTTGGVKGVADFQKMMRAIESMIIAPVVDRSNAFAGPSTTPLPGPLSVNREAQLLLANLVKQVATPPSPKLTLSIPSIAKKIQKKIYKLNPNNIGWKTIAFDFPNANANLNVNTIVKGENAYEAKMNIRMGFGENNDNTSSTLRFGLDDIWRINSDVQYVAMDPKSADQQRLENSQIALKAHWEGENKLLIDFNLLGVIEFGVISVIFNDRYSDVKFTESTENKVVSEFRGTLADTR
ncbi:MAG: serine hydrolase [Oligoflexia bacterium]|nr:serine hydrolase [Oligoflexia bacterium]